MRTTTAVLAVGMLLAACGSKEEKRTEADAQAKAAGFVPPSVISRVDFGTTMDRRFRQLDRDTNDRLTSTEIAPRFKSRVMALDRNGDGAVSAIEWSEGMLKRFDTMDLNHDGTVTSEERHTARERRPAEADAG